MTTVTQSVLRRFAERSLEIFARHAETTVVVASFNTSLVPSATAYMQAYDQAQTAAALRSNAIEDRTDAVDELGLRIRTWLPQLRRDVKAVVNKGLGNANNVAEDMLADAKTIADLIAGHEAESGQKLSYQDALLADLEPAAAAVRTELQSAGGSRQELAALQAEARAAAKAFSRDLVAFRGTLRAAFGRAHPDYQALRVRGRDDEDESTAAAETEVANEVQGRLANETVAVEDDDHDEDGDPQVAAAS